MQKKNYWQRVFACAVLLSVMSVGTMAEADFTYKIDGGEEQPWDGSSNLIGIGNKLEVWGEGQSSGSNSIFGGSVNGTDNISDKTAILYSGIVNSVYGGYSYNGDTIKNTVTFNGGSAKFVYGGQSQYAGKSTDNTVTINAGTTIHFGNVYGGWSQSGEVSGNQVIINGGTIDLSSGNGVICGGHSDSGEVSGNQVIINGGDFTGVTVYGYNDGASSYSNNTLQINSPVTLKKVANFEVIDIFEAGSVTINELTVESGCILKVDGAKITGTAAITGITHATVASGAKLYVGSAVPNKNYKILKGSGINVDADSWRTDEDMGDGFRAMYGLLVDTDNIINSETEFTIRFVEDPLALKKLDFPNIFSNMPSGSMLQKFVENISSANPNLSTQAAIINTMANMNSLANVQQGTQAVLNMATGALQTNIGTGSRAILGRRAEGVGRNSGNRGQVSGMLVQMTRTVRL